MNVSDVMLRAAKCTGVRFSTEILRTAAKDTTGRVQRCLPGVVAAVFGLCCVGCLPKMTAEELASLQPERPAELDRLEMLLGSWETTGEVRLAVLEDVIHTWGTNEARWSLDRRALVDHAELDMGPLGQLTGFTVWSWDEAIGKYRMWWFDSMGEFAAGIVTYDESRKLWRIKTTGSKYGCHTSGRGTIRQIDENTLEWTWREADGWGLINFANMHGISTRRKSTKPTDDGIVSARPKCPLLSNEN